MKKRFKVFSKPFKYFFKLESSSGIVLLFSAVIALWISNSTYSEIYFNILKSYFSIGYGFFTLKLSVIHWINDVLMAIFFFLVTLEIKREFIQGELSNLKKALLPIIGHDNFESDISVININDRSFWRWAIPSATDIAFSLGILSLLGSRVPISLKVFLTALAIIDDLGAILIIAFFYSGDLFIGTESLISQFTQILLISLKLKTLSHIYWLDYFCGTLLTNLEFTLL